MEAELQIFPQASQLTGTASRSLYLQAAQPLHSPNFVVSIANANVSKGKKRPSLDHDGGLPLSFGFLTQVFAALVVCQCLQISVLFVFFFLTTSLFVLRKRV